MKIYLLSFFKLFAKLFYEPILIFLKCEKIVYAPRQKSDVQQCQIDRPSKLNK
jgi:hypothetical protein